MQKHAAGSSLGPVDQMVTASSVPCRCLASDDMFWPDFCFLKEETVSL